MPKINPVQRLMLDDASRSGLTAKELKSLGIAPLTKEETLEITGLVAGGSYRIPYYTLDKRDTGFFRVRLLDGPAGFAKKKLRYWQPPKTLPELYIPHVNGITWSTIAKDTSARLYITEGEKKAACGVKHGLNMLGLGGVWSWKSKKNSIPLLEGFKAFAWKGREVCIVFDNDIHSNEQVLIAMNALAKELHLLGAKVATIKLPFDSKTKQGLDDYIIATGVKEFLALPVEAVGDDQELWKLNEELIYVEEPAGVLQLSTGKVLSKSTLVDLAYANRFITVPDGRGSVMRVNAAGRWLCWTNRRTCSHLTYSPGSPSVLEDGGFNLWKGWGVEPKKGNVEPFTKLITYIFRKDRRAMQWFLQWLAYPLQNPGTKLFTSVLLLSLEHGTGKSLVGYTMGKIYGKNFSAVAGEDLKSQFNHWARNKQFVLGEEITGSDKRIDGDRLKHMISRESISVNIKYQPTYDLPDCVAYFLTSNHPDALFIENYDRRMFIWEIIGAPLPTEFYTKEYDTWKNGEGPAALFYYLLNNIDCSGFDPLAPALMTEAKEDMRELSKSDVDAWAAQLVRDPPSILHIDGKPIGRDLFTAAELLNLYDTDGSKRTTLIALGKALRRAGLRMVGVVRTPKGSVKLWAVRNNDYWAQADHKVKATHYAGMNIQKPSNF